MKRAPAPPEVDESTAAAIVDDAIGRYFDSRRARVDAFAARVFSLRGAFDLNRRALGWDLARAPANVALAAPPLA
ncbi:MAG: hypothetical protein IRY94_16895, partial [Rhodospirillaceae bacterium]|nr:hypothetical protein [Rhodospirillaceae bacterium]